MESHSPYLPGVPQVELKPEKPVDPLETSKVALWRWRIATLIIGLSPLLVVVMGARRGETGEGMSLPRTAFGLIVLCAVELGMFGVVWAIAWAFARPRKDDLFWRWEKSGSAIWWGALYSIVMRFAPAIVMLFAFIWLAMVGVDVKQLSNSMVENGKGAMKTFDPVMQHGSTLYRVLMLTLVSFVTAGFREEMWRAFTMTGLKRITPSNWSPNARSGFALGFSSVVFGCSHAYQGVTGVLQTMVLGIILGAVTLKHKSVWPAVIAHGCFDATSFLLLLAFLKK